jgi:hypothetical protein
MNQNVRTTDDVTFNDLTLNGGDLFLSNGTSNRIIYNQSGVAQPSFTNRSAGTKIVLYPNIGASSVDYAVGIENGTLWSSVPTTSDRFLWYGGVSTAMQLQGSGNLTLAGNLSALQVDTGQGLTEVHLMNQNIRTSDTVTFNNLNITNPSSIDSYWTAGSANAWRFIFADTVNAGGYGVGASGFGIYRNGLSDYHLRFDTAGNVIAPFSLRSPIFYDSADTSFYLDANSYSRLNRVGVGGGANDVSGININGDAAITSANYLYFGHTNGTLGSWQTRINASGGRQFFNNNGFEFNRDGYGGGIIMFSDSSARVGFATSDFSFTASDNTAVVAGGITNNRVFVNGSIQLLGNNDAIVFGRGTSSFFKDEEIGFGWGGGWFMTDSTFLRVRNGASVTLYTPGTIRADGDMRAPIFYDQNNTSFYSDQASTSRYNILHVNKTYQSEQFIDVPGTFNGNRRWVRFSISRFNSGGSPVEISLSRSISDNGSSPYGGCTARFIINSREWHSGQENMWYFYTEHGSFNANQNPYGYFVYQAGPRDLAGGGYWFYMLLLDGVRYRMSVSADMNFNNDNIGSIEYSVADPGGIPRVPLGSGVIGNNNTYNQITSTNAMHSIMYDYDDRNYYIDPNSTSRIRRTNLVASGTSWDDGLNLYSSDEANRWNLLVDNFRLQPDATISYNALYAPIYYDNDNSGFYVDPANGGFVMRGGSSNRVTYTTNDSGFRVTNAEGNGVSDVRIGAAWGRPGVYSNTYLMLGSENYIEFVTGNGQRGYIDSSSNLFAYGSMRSPIFYDFNNTGYYADPASTSVFNVLQFGTSTNSGRFDGSGTWGVHFRTDSGYIQFGPANSSHAHIYTDRQNFYLNAPITINDGSYINQNDIRSAIFYDRNNTAFYLDPNTSATSLRIAGGIAQNNIVGRPVAYWGATGATGAVVIKFPGGTGNYGMIHAVIDIYEYNGNAAATVIVGGHNWNGLWYNFNAEVFGQTDKPVRVGTKDGRYCIVIGNGSSGWSYGQVVLRKIQNGTYYDGVMNVAEGYSVAIESDSYSYISGDLRNLRTPLSFSAGSNISAGSAMFAPIYYDSNNTGYYLDPNSGGVALRLSGAIQGDHTNWTGEHNKIQWHSSHMYFQNMNNGFWLFRRSNGAEPFQLHADGYGRATGDWRAPIFYDDNNTGFYLDPASTNNFNQTEQNGRLWYSNYLVSRNNGGLMGDYNVNGTASKVIWTIGESWPIGNMYGLGYEYASSTFLPGDPHVIALRNNGTTYTRLQMNGGIYTTGAIFTTVAMYTPIYYDSNNTGFYTDPDGTSRTNYIVGNRIKLVNNVNNDPRWDFSAYVVEAQHWYGNNSGMTMYLGESTGNNLQIVATPYANIYYDRQDGGYYVDPNGTSSLARFTQRTHAAMNRGFHWITPRFDYTGDTNYWTGTFGWGTSAGTWANAWKSGFAGWDIWGGGTDHPQGGGYVHAQGIVSGQHLATSDGGSAYGWMMVGAHDAGSRWWLRGKWGGSTYPWYEIMLYDRNVGGGAFYAGIWYDGNNTGYYVDPNGSTQLRTVYADDWFRAQGCAGFYFQSYGRGLWSPECEGNPYGHVATNGGGRNGWGGYGIFSRYTLMSTGGDNVGMHDTARGWVWYMEGGRLQMHWAGNRRMVTESHGVYFDADARASIFYDHDTGYYFDGNGTSSINRFTDRTKVAMGMTGRYNSPRYDFVGGDTNYWVGTMGWGTTDFISAFNWGSGFIDTWGGIPNSPGDTSHYVGIQASHGNFGYNSGYGIQIVGGPIQGLWHTSYWNTKRSWYKIAMYGLNESSGTFWSSIMYDSNDSGRYIDPNGTSFLQEVYSFSYRGNGNVGGTGNASWHPNGIYSAGYNWLYGGMNGGGGHAANFGRMDANIFYDNNNTGYYVDPASTTQLHYVLANNWYRAQGCSGFYFQDWGRGMWSPECSGNPYGTVTTMDNGRNGWFGYGVGSRYTLMTTQGDNFGLHDSARGWIWYMSGAELNLYWAGSRRAVTTSWGTYFDGYTEAGGSVRGPIFYDNQDTGYYLDPHNTDDQGLRIRGGTLHGPNWWWGAYLRVGTNSRVDGWASMFTSNGNLHIDSRNGYPMYLNWHNGNDVLLTGAIQARIYYDIDDTGYFFGASSGDLRTRFTNTNGGISQANNEFQFVTNRAGYVNDTNTANLQACANSNLTAFFSWHKYGVFATNMGLDADNVIRIGGWSMGANRWQLTPGGDMFAAGNVIAYSSDERLKENITTISDALGMLKRLRGVYFDWKNIVDDLGFNPVDRHDIGVIAQEVEKVIPQAIKPAPFDALSDGKSISGQNYKTVQLEKIVPVLIQSVKEQQEIIEKQNKEIEELKTMVYKILNKN